MIGVCVDDKSHPTSARISIPTICSLPFNANYLFIFIYYCLVYSTVCALCDLNERHAYRFSISQNIIISVHAMTAHSYSYESSNTAIRYNSSSVTFLGKWILISTSIVRLPHTSYIWSDEITLNVIDTRSDLSNVQVYQVPTVDGITAMNFEFRWWFRYADSNKIFITKTKNVQFVCIKSPV